MLLHHPRVVVTVTTVRIGSPFETIQYGVNQLSSGGDKLYIRAGTYRETITINKIGTSGNPIIIEAYGSEEVTIDGTVDITGSWTSHGNGIYKLSSYSTNITQLFVDNEPMVNARWPNAQFNDDSVFSLQLGLKGMKILSAILVTQIMLMIAA